MPQVLDPFFARTVVFLVHHDDEGSLGYILNRPMDLKVRDLCSNLGISWQGDPERSVNFGGPVQAEVGAVLYRGDVPGVDETPLWIPPDLRLTANKTDLETIATAPPAEMLLLLGYAGWGPGQIDSEFMRGDWLTAEPVASLIFGRHADDTWRLALESIGVDPGALPAARTGGDGDAVN
jgi:putative transcriptional regulator